MTGDGRGYGGLSAEQHAANVAIREANLHGPTHGAHRWLRRGLAPPCDTCLVHQTHGCAAFAEGATCRLAEDAQASLTEQVLALPHVDACGPAVRVLAVEWARLVVALQILDGWLSCVGPMTWDGKRLDVQPAMTARLRLSTRVEALARELGITPAAQHRMRDSGGSAMEALARLLRQPDLPPVEVIADDPTA